MHSRIGIVTLLLALSPFANCYAQSSNSTAPGAIPVSSNHQLDKWAALIEKAVPSISANTLPKPPSELAKLQSALDELDRFVGTGSNGDRWRKFLRWDSLQKELKAEEPDLFELDQLQLNMRQNYQGLELSQFTRVRQSIDEYASALRYGNDPAASVEAIQKQLEAFVEKLKTTQENSPSQIQRDFGLLLNILDNSRQAPELASAIRSEFSRPNIRVLASEHFLSSKAVRPVDETNPVSECILGTAISGSSLVRGSVFPRLVPNSKHATLKMEMVADFQSDNQGYNRGVVILTQGSSALRASETISLTDLGLTSLNDTAVDTNLHNQINAILHKRKIVRKIASKKAAEQKPQADMIGESRMREKITRQYHEKLVESLDSANQRLTNADLSLLMRLGVAKPIRSSWTSSQFLSALWKATDGKQMMANSSCPLPVESTGLTLQVHQSMIANLIDPVLGNRVIESRKIPTIVQQFTKEVPDAIRKLAEEDPWSITLVPFRPVEVDFDKQLITIRIRASELRKGDQNRERPTIEATYKVELIDNSIQLVRQGEVSIKFPGNQGSIGAAAMRGFFKGKFDQLFKEKLFANPLRPLDSLPAGAPKLDIASIQVDQEWMQIHLR